MEEPYWAKYVLKWCQHKCDKGIELGLSEENTRRLGHDQTVKSSGLRFEFFFLARSLSQTVFLKFFHLLKSHSRFLTEPTGRVLAY